MLIQQHRDFMHICGVTLRLDWVLSARCFTLCPQNPGQLILTIVLIIEVYQLHLISTPPYMVGVGKKGSMNKELTFFDGMGSG